MQFGFVVCNMVVLLFIGVAGAGKSSFARFVLNLPPLKKRESTSLAECAIRATSITRTKVEQSGTTWHPVSAEELITLIADSIPLGGSVINYNSEEVQATSRESDHDMTTARIITENVNSKTVQPNGDVLKHAITRLYLELIKNLLSKIEKSGAPKQLLEGDWIYLIDSGGQPQFHELLPTFVHHASGAAFFVKLNEELNSHPTIEYYRKGGVPSGDPYPSSLTHLEILQNCLQTMQSRNNVSGEIECPELFFVGTHRDLEASCKESSTEKNKCLHEMLLQHDGFKNHLSYYRLSKPEALLYPVNSITPQDCDHKVVGDFRQAVINGCKKDPVKIPIVWFLLEQLLQKLSQSKQSHVLSFEECLEAAKHFKMNEVQLKAAIEHLVRLNIFEYFPKILPNIVFISAQVLLDKVSELVEYSHRLRSKPIFSKPVLMPCQVGCDSESRKFRDHGTINIKLLKKFSAHFVDDLFDPKDLLKLWVHLLVIAKISDDHYFMPCVLPELPTEQLAPYRLNPSKDKLVPLLIHYPGQWFPSGIFTSLISFLENRSNWKIILKHGTPSCLYKNCIKFRLKTSPIAITLIYSLKFIELHVRVPDDSISKDDCLGICSVVLKGLKKAAAIQNYNYHQPQLAFICGSSHDNTEATSDNTLAPHLASLSDNQEWLICSLDEESVTMVTGKQKLWLNKKKSEEAGDSGSQHVLPTLESFYPPTNGHNSSKSLEEESGSQHRVPTLDSFYPPTTGQNTKPISSHQEPPPTPLVTTTSLATERKTKKSKTVSSQQEPSLTHFESSDNSATPTITLETNEGYSCKQNFTTDFKRVTPLTESKNDHASAYMVWRLNEISDQLNGEGIVIAIIDNGVSYEHDAFKTAYDRGRLRGRRYLPKGETTAVWGAPKSGENTDSHGTMAAFVAGGEPFRDVKNGGVAPKSTLWICSVGGDFDEDSIINALKDLIKMKDEGNRYAPDVISISFGIEYFPGDQNQKEIEKYLKALMSKGVVIVAAAGNFGIHKGGLQFPANISGVISVGAHDELGERMNITPRGNISCYAPGKAVLHPVAHTNNEYMSSQGTSCAAPAVAGLIALLLQFSKKYVTNDTDKEEYRNSTFLEDFLAKNRMTRPQGDLYVLDPVRFFKEKIGDYERKQLIAGRK